MWKSVKIIGQGGFGLVKMAKVDQEDEDGHLPPVIAIKSVPLVHLESLQKEREAFSNLEGSPYLVHCYKADASKEDSVLYYNLLLEYAYGGSLADRLKHGGRLCEEEARKQTKVHMLVLAVLNILCDLLMVSNCDNEFWIGIVLPSMTWHRLEQALM
ncbi:hypothetical protein RJ639_023431 [Escallonia herrerae]|uniref:Protein kinase domain-containing protein n=1 Tax=Escallonia herrerae TaxID=1293975 RepID=A0AA89AFF9_9ASTE|nr:hypothetical protein RJ639_023431 [Escallonia herrerae]